MPAGISLYQLLASVGPGWRAIILDAWISLWHAARARRRMARPASVVSDAEHLSTGLILHVWPPHCGAEAVLCRVARATATTCEHCGGPGHAAPVPRPRTDGMYSRPVVRCLACWADERDGRLPHPLAIGLSPQETGQASLLIYALAARETMPSIDPREILRGTGWRPDPRYDRPWAPGLDAADDARDGEEPEGWAG